MDIAPPPVIETPRGRLRRLAEPPGEGEEPSAAWLRDRSFFVAVRTDPDTIRWHMDVVPDSAVDHSEAWMRRQARRPWGNYLLEVSAEVPGEDSITVAGVGIVRPVDKPPMAPRESANENDVTHLPEIGYVVHPLHRGCGYAGEAVRGLVTSFWDTDTEHQWAAIGAQTDSENIASEKVLQKCGFRIVQTIERDSYSEVLGGWRDTNVWTSDRPSGCGSQLGN